MQACRQSLHYHGCLFCFIGVTCLWECILKHDSRLMVAGLANSMSCESSAPLWILKSGPLLLIRIAVYWTPGCFSFWVELFMILFMEEILHQLIGSLSVYPIIYRVFIHPRWWSPDFFQQYGGTWRVQDGTWRPGALLVSCQSSSELRVLWLGIRLALVARPWEVGVWWSL